MSTTAARINTAPFTPAPAAKAATTITVSITVPAHTDPAEAAALASSLRDHAQQHHLGARGATVVSISTAKNSGSVAPTRYAPASNSRGGIAPISPLRPRRSGVVSPTSPARQDALAARSRAAHATAVSPASPSEAGPAGLIIDLYGRRVRIGHADVELTHREFELVAHLARHSRTVVSRSELMSAVWACEGGEIGERTVDVHVRRVRAKLGSYRRLISTVRGTGYRFDPGSDVTVIG